MALCFCIPGIFNYYHLSLLLTTLNCVADPALYCFVSESARRGLYGAFIRPVARMLCCCCRRGNASPSNPANDSHEVATDENNAHPTVTLLTHTSTHNMSTTDAASKNTTLITQTGRKTLIPLIAQNNKHKSSCVTAVKEQRQTTERTEVAETNAC